MMSDDEDLKEGLMKSMSEPAKKLSEKDDESDQHAIADKLKDSREKLRTSISDREKAFKDLDSQMRADKKKRIDSDWEEKFNRNKG